MIGAVDYIRVIVAAVASMAMGFLWYSDNLFGKTWRKMMGFGEKMPSPAKNEMAKMYSLTFVGALVMAYVLANFVDLSLPLSALDGVMVGFWAWLGFVAPVQMSEVLFGGKPWKLYYINTGYQLASLLLMGAILAY